MSTHRYPDKGIVEREYKRGRPVQWGAFTSTTTDFAAAKGFTDRAAGVIFKIAISSGRDINAYSFFPQVWAGGVPQQEPPGPNHALDPARHGCAGGGGAALAELALLRLVIAVRERRVHRR